MTDPNTTTPATLRADALDLLREIAARKRYDPNVPAPWGNNSGWNTIILKSELLARVDALLDATAAAPAVEPIRLVHVALAEDGGNLRWMTGRKPRDCELYMMPDGGRAPAVVYATRSAPVAEYDGNHMQDRCCECNDYEAECRCAEPSEIEQVIACLGDDAAKLREANADDEMADNMEAAARLLSERAALSPAPVDEAAQDEQALLDEALSNHGYGHASVDGRERHHFKKGFKARAAVSPATAATPPDVAFKPWHERHADVFSNEGDAWRAFLDARATVSQSTAEKVYYGGSVEAGPVAFDEPATADERAALLQWATERWDAEVKHRPLINVHRRSLDDTWRQVIRHCGGDDVSLLGPRHDALLAANPINTTERDPAFIDNDLDFEPDAQHAVADMANIGYALMQTIERMVPGYCWNESPTEIVSDLLNERDEARASQAPAPADTRDVAAFIREVATQKPEKPDHWSPCGQCQRNAERAQDLLDAACAQSIDLPDSEGGEA
ncbi:hypothetical protein [Burkholderia gladioli]|uniref:hypothetical protein n=1 Tax=Burkholderia gladioli TaxID=28095 RepID=UPI002006B69F|nr:hypothetical protein [Burkholderia gladioli]MDN8060141.1 hypothetical protein [Burkholderia gladioli]